MLLRKSDIEYQYTSCSLVKSNAESVLCTFASDSVSEALTLSSIPNVLIPRRFRIAKASKRVALVLFFVAYPALLFLSGFVYALYKNVALSSLSAANWWKAFGAVGDFISFGILVFSYTVNNYSVDTYVRDYFRKAKALPDYANTEDPYLRVILSAIHGKLKATTKNVLTTELGAALLAASSFVTIVGTVVKG